MSDRNSFVNGRDKIRAGICANTVAYSAGAVCCPDEASARWHIDACIWFVDGVEHYMTPLVDSDWRWTR